jgi:hypothetical protein
MTGMSICSQPLGKDEWCCLKLGHVGKCITAKPSECPPGRHEFVPRGQPRRAQFCQQCGLGEAEGNHGEAVS